MGDQERDPQAVVMQINRLTQTGQLHWEAVKPNPSFFAGSNQRVEVFYNAIFKGRHLQLYRLKEKYFYDENQFFWDDSIKLEFTDDEGNTLWTFPYSPALVDLFNTVSYQAADIGGAFDDFLNPDD